MRYTVEVHPAQLGQAFVEGRVVINSSNPDVVAGAVSLVLWNGAINARGTFEIVRVVERGLLNDDGYPCIVLHVKAIEINGKPADQARADMEALTKRVLVR